MFDELNADLSSAMFASVHELNADLASAMFASLHDLFFYHIAAESTRAGNHRTFDGCDYK